VIWRSLSVLVLGVLLLGAAPEGTRAGRSARGAEELPPPRTELFTVLFTGETRGNLTPCSCPDGPWGGLARRVGYLESRREETRGPVLSLHTGGFLPVGAVPLRNDPKAEVQLVSLLMESVLRSRIDVLALEPGERDYLAQIAPDLWWRLDPYSLDCVPPSPPRVVSLGGTPVAILALDESLDDQVLESAGRKARAVAELVFVLARADGVSGRRIAARTGADLVILSFGVRTETPVRYENSWVVGAGREGKEIGELRLERTEQGLRVADYRLVPMDETVPVHAVTDELVRHLLDDFGPGWRTLLTPVE